MNVLVLNAGSATLKFQLIETDADRMGTDGDIRAARGMVDSFGDRAEITIEVPGRAVHRETTSIPDQAAALDHILRWLSTGSVGVPVISSIGQIDAVGHRVVHGGERFRESVLIDADVQRAIAENSALAPLHNPHNLRGIEAATELLGDAVPQVAVFDTAFHATLPEHAFLYAIPYELYDRHRVRRYGFHGTSHRFVAERYPSLAGAALDSTRLISLHLGNGCSACAIAGGRSVDTSMGLTPLEGLVMGTRSGDIDPAIFEFISRTAGLDAAAVDSLLNRESGLLGISGRTNDMRILLEEAEKHGDPRAALAIAIFAYRARKYIGAYLAALGGADAIIFTGGIGENAAPVRAMICEGLEWAGVAIDSTLNEAMAARAEGPISTPESTLAAWVIPTDEELLIARDTVRVAFA